MAPKCQKTRNIVDKFTMRQLYGNNFVSARFPRSITQIKPKLARLCIPLRDIMGDNSFASGHVLLGFSRCGHYLLSYLKEQQGDFSFGLPVWSYTLHWWRFNMRRQLQKVCCVSLFAGEIITEDLLLTVCQTGRDNRVIVHGHVHPGHDEQCRQCFVTICTSPTGNKPPTSDETCVVHMKYNLLPPFPLLVPSVQMKLERTVILNTVDSILAISISPICARHTITKLNAASRSVTRDDNVKQKHSSDDEVYEVETDTPDDSDETLSTSVSNVFNRIDKHDDLNIVPSECKECFDKLVETPPDEDEDTLYSLRYCRNCRAKIDESRSEISDGDVERPDSDSICNSTPGPSHLSSFNYKTFCNTPRTEVIENSLSSPIIDGTTCLEIQVNTVENIPYVLTETLQGKHKPMKDHDIPCIHTRTASLDVERYIIEALSSSWHLEGKYWVLNNYSTLLVDVCEHSHLVVVHVIVLVLVQENTKRETSSFSIVLTWNILSGVVDTLNISPTAIKADKRNRQVFEEGCKTVADLHKQCSVPNGLFAATVFSNRNVFHGRTLKIIRHPFQPIAIVL